MTGNGDGGSGSLERLITILDAFAGLRALDGKETGPLGVSELSRGLEISKGTISRYLRRLEEVGVLQRLPDRRYVLGSRVYAWGQAATPGSDVKRWAHVAMEHLAGEFKETVSLFVRQGDEAICIEQVDGLFPIRLSAAVGRHLPLHVGASPRLLLAFAPDEEREAFLRREPFPVLAPATMTEAAALRQAIDETRRLGYVLSESESDEGAVGVAAPIRDAGGVVQAALSIAGPATRIVGAQREAVIAGVCDAAATISHALGYRPASEGHVA